MASSFKPPGVERLTDIDVADCEYNAEAVEIEGLVSAKSQGGWPRTDDYEIHCFSVVAWRRVGGRLIQQELTILRPVPPQFDYWSDYPAYSVHRLHLLLSQDEKRAIVAGPSQVIDDDSELLAIAGELQKPVVISTSQFGDLTLDRRLDRFEGEPNWNGIPVYITFEKAVFY
ncbi:MAG: hypothetical protein IAF94_14095 [Pirellulaceae bacterium]|nr:hypothetical protein [Pirellulaceae bacterium]